MKIRRIMVFLYISITIGQTIFSHPVQDLERMAPHLAQRLKSEHSSLKNFTEYLTRMKNAVAVPQKSLSGMLTKAECILAENNTNQQTHLFTGTHDTDSLILMATSLIRLGINDILFNVIDPTRMVSVDRINEAARPALEKNQRFSIQTFPSMATYNCISTRLTRRPSIIHIASSGNTKKTASDLMEKCKAQNPHPLVFLTEGTKVHRVSFKQKREACRI